jgi:hypothetical protein
MKKLTHDLMGANGDDEALLRVLARFGFKHLGAGSRNALFFIAVLYGTQQGLIPFFPKTLGVAGSAASAAEIAATESRLNQIEDTLEETSHNLEALVREFDTFKGSTQAELEAIRDSLERIEGRINSRWR